MDEILSKEDVKVRNLYFKRKIIIEHISLDRYFPFGLANTAGFDTVDNILAVRIHNESKNDGHDPYYRLRTCILGKETSR